MNQFTGKSMIFALHRHPPSHHLLSTIQHEGLAGGEGGVGGGEGEAAGVAVVCEVASQARGEGAGAAVEGGGFRAWRLPADPAQVREVHLRDRFLSALGDDEPIARCILCDDFEGDFETPHTEAAALADRVEGQTLVAADDGAIASDDGAGQKRILEVPLQEFLRLLLGEEAEVLAFAVALIVERNTVVLRERVDIALEHRPKRKEDATELLLRKSIEVVALVLRLIASLEEEHPLAPIRESLAGDPCVVAGCELLAAKLVCELQECTELDQAVAADAGVGCQAAPVPLEERVDDVLLEFLLEIHDVEWDPESLGGCC